MYTYSREIQLVFFLWFVCFRQVIVRARNLRAGANFIPPKAFRARRVYFSNEVFFLFFGSHSVVFLILLILCLWLVIWALLVWNKFWVWFYVVSFGVVAWIWSWLRFKIGWTTDKFENPLIPYVIVFKTRTGYLYFSEELRVLLLLFFCLHEYVYIFEFHIGLTGFIVLLILNWMI